MGYGITGKDKFVDDNYIRALYETLQSEHVIDDEVGESRTAHELIHKYDDEMSIWVRQLLGDDN